MLTWNPAFIAFLLFGTAMAYTIGTYLIEIVRAFLDKHALVSPEFDYELFSKCMAYAVESGWGARLFPI